MQLQINLCHPVWGSLGSFSPMEGRPGQECYLGQSKGWVAHLLRSLTWGFSTKQPFFLPLYTSL